MKLERLFFSLQIPAALGTEEVLDRIVAMIGRDELGRPATYYGIVFRALRELDARLQAEQAQSQQRQEVQP